MVFNCVFVDNRRFVEALHTELVVNKSGRECGAQYRHILHNLSRPGRLLLVWSATECRVCLSGYASNWLALLGNLVLTLSQPAGRVSQYMVAEGVRCNEPTSPAVSRQVGLSILCVSGMNIGSATFT